MKVNDGQDKGRPSWYASLFRVLWATEAILLILWLWDELSLDHLSVNPVVWIGFLYLLVSLLLRQHSRGSGISLILVLIPGLVLGIMLLMMVTVFLIELLGGPIRWN